MDGLDLDHASLFASRAESGRIRIDRLVTFSFWCLRYAGSRVVSKAQEPPAKGKLLSALAIGEESTVSDSHESLGEDVEEESPEEFHGIEGHGALLVALSVVLPGEADVAVLEGEEALVGDRDPVGVTGEIFENLMRTPKGWFGIDNPVPLPKGSQKPFPVVRVGEGLQLSVEGQRPFLESLLQIGEKLPLE
jgi:hypothetical protein